MNKDKEFAGKVALVTGGTKGIGKCIALMLAEGGADVVVNYFRSRNAADETIEQLNSFGGDHLAIRCNIGNHEKMPKVYNHKLLIHLNLYHSMMSYLHWQNIPKNSYYPHLETAQYQSHLRC